MLRKSTIEAKARNAPKSRNPLICRGIVIRESVLSITVPARHRRICGSVPVLRHTTTRTEPVSILPAVGSANRALASRSKQNIELRIDRLEVELQRELDNPRTIGC